MFAMLPASVDNARDLGGMYMYYSDRHHLISNLGNMFTDKTLDRIVPSRVLLTY